jgi:iron complex outermembrane recepter protein
MHHRLATLSRVLVFIALLGLAALPSIARTDPPTRFDLPAEPLDQALRDFAIQAKYNISYEPSAVRGLQAPAIKGDYSAADVLILLLKGTPLRAVHVNADTIQVLQKSKSSAVDASSSAAGHDSAANMIHLDYAVSNASSAGSSVTVAPGADQTSAPDDDTLTKDLTEIVVTGTNIRGVENKTVPLLTFDRDAIDRSGYATTQDFIDSLPQNVKSGANSADGILTGQGIGNIENSSAANLRGLGTSSTLTLLNGHRVAPSSYGSGVDLSMIPLSAVERIEVLTDGSSAVYGSDAVGGVINIILRKDFNGAESSVRFDTLTQGGGEVKQIGQSLGHTWNTGGALLVLQYEDDNAIHADERSFTEKLPEPTDIYPSQKRYSGVFSGHQTLAPSLEIFADALAEHDDGFRAYTTGGAFGRQELISSTTDALSANTGLRWQPFGDWHLEGDTLFTQSDSLGRVDYTPAAFGYTNGAPQLRNLFTIKEVDLKLDGTLWTSGGSSIKAAVGATYRREDFSSLIEYTDMDRPLHRRVSAAYAEVYAPMIGSENAVTLVQKLEFSVAVRTDDYSDFGAKTDPRFGVFWSPVDQVALRAAYSSSFRSPNAAETVSDLNASNAFIDSGYPLPNGAVGNVLFFGNQSLGPETSRNLTAGLDFTPTALPGTRLSLNYYRIIYSNRIINAPQALNVFVNPQVYGPLIKTFSSDAAVAAFLASLDPPQTLYDYSTGGTGIAGVRYGFPYGDINATKERTEGFDLGLHSLLPLAGTNKLIFDINATYIREIETTFCDACASTDLVNTYGEPLKFRARGAAGWSNGIFSTNAAVNYANAYADTNVVPSGHIASFVTTDLNATWRIPSTRTTVGFAVTNLFNADPPRTAPAVLGVEYDPTNADPRGRAVSLQVRQKW